MPYDVAVSQLGPSAAALLSALQAAAFAGDCWTADSWSVLLHQPGVVARAAHRRAAPAGAPPLGMLLTRMIADHAEILTVGVLPEARRHGVARALVGDFLRVCRRDAVAEVTLEVAMTNTAARALYGDFGFRQVGHRRRYYTAPDGATTDAAVLLYNPR